MSQNNIDSPKVNLIAKNDTSNCNNIENISDISNINIEEEKNKIPPSSPLYIFCESLKEINTQNETGWTPIYRSVLANNIPALTELLKLGGNPNISNNLGETPLYLSIENQNYEALTKLLEYKADPNIKKRNGNTPLHIALKKKLENKYILILINNKADPNISNKLYSQTPTHMALINKCDEEILKSLKENKADIYEIKDKYDKTPFDYAKDLNDNEYLNKIISIFGKKEEIKNDENFQIKTNNKKNDMNSINLIKISDDNNIAKGDKNINLNNEISFNYLKSNQLITQNNNILFDKINKYDLKNDNIALKLNINNAKEKMDEESNKENKNININNNPLTLDILDTNYLLNTLNKVGNITKKNNQTDLKNKILIPEYLKVETKNDNDAEKVGLSNNYTNNNDFNSIVSRNKNKSNDNNLFASNVNSSLCYSLSKETQTQKKKESESEIEIKNKIPSNPETDKKIIKPIVFSTTKQGKGSNNENNNNLPNNNINIDLNNSNQINKIINNNKNAETKIFSPKNISNEIENIFDNENKNKKIEKRLEENTNPTNNNINDNIKLNKFEIGEDHIKNVNKLKININEINNENDIDNKIFNKENDNLVSLTNNSNIFSELQMNSTDGNYNRTKEEQKEDNLIIKENEIIFSKNNTNNGNISNIIKKSSIQIKETFSDEKNFDINFSISNYNENVINSLKTKEIDTLKKDFEDCEEQNQNQNHDEKKSDINVNISYLNNKIIDTNSDNKNEIISQKENNTNKNGINQVNNSQRQISYHNIYNNKKNKNDLDKDKNNTMNINNEDEIAEMTNKTSRTNKTSKIINIISEKKNNNKKGNKYNKKNENPNNLMIYHNKNFLARTSNKKKIIKNTNPNFTINLRHKIYYGESKSTDKKDNKILYSKQKIYRHSSPDYNYNYQRHFNKDNLITENSYKNNNNSFISILNTNRTNDSNNNIYLYDNTYDYTMGKRMNYNNKNNNYSNQYPLYNPYDDSIEGNNTNIIVYRNKNKLNKNNFIYNPNSFNNTTFSSYHNNICKIKNKNYLEPLINRNSVSNNSFSNNSNSNCNSYRNNSGSSSYRNSNNQNILINDDNNNVYITKNNGNYNHLLCLKHNKTISNNILIRLRDWLISCDLLCYYNILIRNNMYNIDSYIDDIRNNKIDLSFKDIEELGIRKPGHIFRLLLKLEVDAGKIDNNLYNYIIEKFNINTATNNGVLTSSINDIKCCGLNCCSTNNKHNCNNRRIINNNNMYNENYYINNNYGDIKTNSNETENDYCEEINYSDIFSFLKRKNLWKFKENFIHNGFDQIEYILIQLFSNYSFDKTILNDYMHIYLDEEKNYVLKKLYYEKKKICNILGLQYNKEELRLILFSQSSSGENYYNSYMSSAMGTHSNNHNNNSCCSIY